MGPTVGTESGSTGFSGISDMSGVSGKSDLPDRSDITGVSDMSGMTVVLFFSRGCRHRYLTSSYFMGHFILFTNLSLVIHTLNAV